MDWPHQVFAVEELRRARDEGKCRLCITSPTGGGKSRIMQRIIEWGRPTLVMTNRVMLIEQLAAGLEQAGIYFGMHASGYAPEAFERVQIASIQSMYKWWKEGRHDLPEAEIVILDECHNETGQRSIEILDEYVNRGATIIGVTATPVGVGHMFDHLIQAGCTSELRACGALVPAVTYAPDEPDTRSYKPQTKGLLQFRGEVKEVMLPVIFGRVLEHYDKLNPGQTPTVLFAPGVEESRWFCEQFNDAGIPWSHIDAQHIVLNGVEMAATRENRALLRAAAMAGKTKGVSNRFVLREGIDWPFLTHGIFACTFGSITSYLQAGGRLLRQHYIDGVPQLQSVTLMDHGGNFWRHDSLNVDREWSLDDTDKKIQDRHDEKHRTKEEPEPIVCPKCAFVRRRGVRCPKCNFAYEGRRRVVIQTDGTLREVRGDIYKPRREARQEPQLVKDWKACVFRCKNSGRTFSQARALFQREHSGMVPGADFPLQPVHPSDWAMKVSMVPYDRLTKGEAIVSQ